MQWSTRQLTSSKVKADQVGATTSSNQIRIMRQKLERKLMPSCHVSCLCTVKYLYSHLVPFPSLRCVKLLRKQSISDNEEENEDDDIQEGDRPIH